MKNADKPAHPVTKDPRCVDGSFVGLSKREAFAMAGWTESEIKRAAQEVADEMNSGNRSFDNYVSPMDPWITTKARVRLADKLLQELELKEE